MNSALPNSLSAFDWLPQLLQTNDSFFPSGAFAHSFGLEGLVQLGLVEDAPTLGQFLHGSVRPALRQFELPIVKRAYEAAQDGHLSRLIELDSLYAAMKGAHELRQASSRIGSQRLQMLLHLAPHPILRSLEEARQTGRFAAHAPIIFGVQTALSLTPLDAALLGYHYQNLVALVSAAFKLIRIGQMAGQTLLTECLSHARDDVERAQAVAEDDLGWFQPVLDIASARHEAAYTRIFIS
jgi:urease accessory protein